MLNMEINISDGQILGQRSEQQDSRINLQLQNGDYRLYVLADGMGGQIGGALASKEVIKGIVNYFENQSISEAPLVDLNNAVQEANSRITEILRDQPHMNGMGTTVIALLHEKESNNYWFVSVGDSPLYKWSHETGLARVNANHAYYEELLKEVEQGILSQEKADNHEQRHAITSALMGKNIELIDSQSGTLIEGEILLIASDGVQTLDDGLNGEIDSLLKSSVDDLDTMVSGILKAVEEKKNPYQDNTTLILVKPFTALVENDASGKKVNTSLISDEKPQQKKMTKRNVIAILIFVLLIMGVALFYLNPVKELFASVYSTVTDQSSQVLEESSSQNLEVQEASAEDTRLENRELELTPTQTEPETSSEPQGEENDSLNKVQVPDNSTEQ